MIKYTLLMCLLLLSLTNIVFADIYKWTDEQGNVHFSNNKSNTPETIKVVEEKPSLQISQKAKEQQQIGVANKPKINLLQPKAFEPVLKFFITIAIMFGAMLLIVAFIVKRFNPKYKDSSIFSLMINLWLNNKPRKEKKRNVEIYSDEYPYEKSNLLTRSEKDFFKALEIAVLNKYHVFPQVGLSRIIDVPQDTYNRQGHFNKISSKSIDYVICDRENFSTLLVIELDGESHNTKDQQDRDDFKDKALDKAGINLLRVIAQKTYNTGQLRETLQRYINLESSAPTIQTTTQNIPQKEKICTAPGCYGVMKIRTAKNNLNYWVCSEYNKCKTAVAVKEAGA